jgi:hypothetical protein
MTVRVYRSTDPGAPNSLTGQIGSLIPVLDACLVTGYGSGGDAKPAAGWVKEYAATNKAAYRSAVGARMFYRFDDNNPFGGSTNHVAGIRGYESMSGIDVANGPFPTTLTHANGQRFGKSNVNNSATPRPWLIVADEKTCWMLINQSGADSNNVNVGELYGFGDFVSDKSGDPWNAFIIAGQSSADTSWFWNPCLTNSINNASPTSSTSGIVVRDHLGTPSAPRPFEGLSRGWDTGAPGNNTAVPYPDPVSGGMRWEKEVPITCAGVLRGKLPGIGYPLHAGPLEAGDTFTADGRLWLAINPVRMSGSGNSRSYQLFIDTTGPWV